MTPDTTQDTSDGGNGLLAVIGANSRPYEWVRCSECGDRIPAERGASACSLCIEAADREA